jgi:type IV fimbrial biogenesis protein FimT
MQKQRGFTLVELMVVVAIAAVLIAMAVPSFTGLIKSNQVSSAVNTFMSDVRFARSEAIKRGGSVVMCRSNTPDTSPPKCHTGSGTNGWISGWIIFQSLNSSTDWVAGDTLLRIQPAITSVNSMVEKNDRSTLSFTATGRLQSVGSVMQIQVGVSPELSNEQQRVVCINLGGRAKIAGDGTSSC